MKIYRNNRKSKPIKTIEDLTDFLKVAHEESGNAKTTIFIIEYVQNKKGEQCATIKARQYYETDKN